MKFKFKIQDYQTDAVNAVVGAFAGQPFNDRLSYLRDIGSGTAQGSFQDSGFWSGTGFGNAPLSLSDEKLLDNIRALQIAGSCDVAKKNHVSIRIISVMDLFL
ncbi:MAG: hypothetical protein K2I95_04065 [Treponemataceae bacterium]|nr:hypothetical protein [Treponemataceae bacterium]